MTHVWEEMQINFVYPSLVAKRPSKREKWCNYFNFEREKNLIFAPFNPQGKIAFVCARKKEKRKLFIQYGSNEKSLVIFNNRTSKPIFINREKVWEIEIQMMGVDFKRLFLTSFILDNYCKLFKFGFFSF